MPNSAAQSPLHLLGNFLEPYTGAERELPDLAHCLQGRREVILWSATEVHPGYARMGVRRVNPAAGEFPRGGMLLLGGVHVALDKWLADAGLERVAVRFNLPQVKRLLAIVALLRATTGLEAEVLYASKPLQEAAGWPGVVEPSLIKLDDFLAVPVERAPGRPFTVGRASRDVLEKHNPRDPMLYRMLASAGVRVRLMGGTCLAPQLGGYPGIELIPTGSEPMAAFYASLDALVYRTGEFYEPYGRVVFEAMASGLPCVVSERGGYAPYIDAGTSSFLFSEQEEAFDRLMALNADPALRVTVGHAARAHADRLHGAAAVEALARYYLD